MVTYNWADIVVDYVGSKNGLPHVIETIHWRLQGIDDEGVTEEIYGVTSLPNPNPSEFTSIEDINREIVIQWLETILNQLPEGEELISKSQLDIYRESIEDKLQNKKNPENIATSLNL